ncbi:hypothetical protein [Paenibacillus eucommiae]|uniref:Alpha-L-rhamnosidase six-hairpin glycosidase domain-containing protein n=1 Tax=Paenibacillus eucommiae TaxID=1355755 RepID=A0ABS4IVT7_9BACL|nr:hypothetical protein [Paenibacillus eucommiae]MBP1991111.1 hypothetical protein [Paenibacillus eucommiae]
MQKLAILWANGPSSGSILVRHGVLISAKVISQEGEWSGEAWSFQANGDLRIELEVEESDPLGKVRTVVTVQSVTHPFSFFVQDVSQDYPIYIPAYGAAVTESGDLRSYNQLQQAITDRGLLTNLTKLEAEPEESYDNAAAATRNQPSPIWLGTGRDTRIFEAQARGRASNNFWSPPVGGSDLQWDWIQPRQHSIERGLPENEGRPVRYYYMSGRGMGCADNVTRRLEDGILPILHTTFVDDDIRYHSRSFVSYESTPLVAGAARGTHYLLADGYGFGHMFTEEQAQERAKLLEAETSGAENTVFYCSIDIENTAMVPRYAWFKNLIPNIGGISYSFDGRTGFAQYAEDRVFCVTFCNGKPLRTEETAILLKPGETVKIEFYLPHEPISRERAERLGEQKFQARFEECRSFWKQRCAKGGQIKLPEKRIEEMIQAGLLHLDLVSYGKDPEGTIVPAIGIYTAIGSESSPIIQFMDSMGWGDMSARALAFFLDKQHEDGFIQNFGGYMLETGAALWCIGEHYRYTRDDSWLAAIKPKLLKSYQYLLSWRERNEREELRGRGYGMIEGKTADPEDPFHSYMLNGYAYLGLSRLAEILAESDPDLSSQIGEHALLLKADIRTAFFQSVASSPVVPLGDGSWVPTAPPWVEANAPLALYEEGENCFTHATFMGRDSMLGPLYLLFHEVIALDESVADFMMNYHNELMLTRNVGFSQPYYCIHPWAHIKRGEVKPFLKAYYNSFAGLADRETYSFWEHYYQVSPHKTHEEAWFLMQSRWMLYMEEGDVLRLLPAIPRKWLEHGEVIELTDLNSYFGKFSLTVKSELNDGRITAKFTCGPERRPASVKLRLPHPAGKKASHAVGGAYIESEEAVLIHIEEEQTELTLFFE